ncbi:TIGR03435 family protein [Granulicella sp. 5B5]|uniref:TIGR03435 family protein n=1 Tax=Granulicella sp. 5B5 TaxID=1617967 RepID=UPI0015F52D13|nr:TIGR03435 family protein [Granulicella sp. 5B5]
MTKRRMGCVAAGVVAFLLMAVPVRAQLPTISDVDPGHETAAAGPLPQWDVAVVKPHPAADRMMSWQMTADGLSLVNLALEQMICSAWDLKPYQVSGLSGWMKDSTFDLTAKVSSDDVAAYKKLSVAQRREMLQKLLEERFQLKAHTETKTLPVYDLVVDKGGPKLKASTAIAAPSEEEERANPDKYKKGFMRFGSGMYEGTGVEVRSLASQLGNAVGKPVNDKTGLTGVYDITLHYSQDGRPDDGAPGGDNSDAPSVFTAVQDQLGLKLVPDKGPVETLVVDSAQKPEAN